MENRNIYQIARESAGFTQERAAEMIGISVESIRAYESDKRIPPNKVVKMMVDIYNRQYLAYQHIVNMSEDIGMCYIPNVEIKDLPSAILRLHKEVSDFLKCRDILIEITCDGIISEDERPSFDAVMKELDDITEAIMAVKYAQ